MEYKILIDQNISRKLPQRITETFPSSTHVIEAGMERVSDLEIWNYAKENDYSILSKDLDFYNLSTTFGCPPKVIKLNCGNRSTTYIRDCIVRHYSIIKEFMTGDDCYLEIE